MSGDYSSVPCCHYRVSTQAPIAESSLRSRLSRERIMNNLLLRQLGQDDFSRLEPYLKITAFRQHTILFEAEREIEHVYFPSGVSLVLTLESGEMIEAAMVGSDGVVGASAAAETGVTHWDLTGCTSRCAGFSLNC